MIKRKKFIECIEDYFDQVSEGQTKDVIKIYIEDIPNRNPSQVSDAIWHKLIVNHIKGTHYN